MAQDGLFPLGGHHQMGINRKNKKNLGLIAVSIPKEIPCGTAKQDENAFFKMSLYKRSP
ncbi:hypothetical protein [Maribacter sp. 2307ULW6-5]|uniref:hypothetical protein n=1 Tax=Maribacter sp. 2307ULW6-5 TaxID=3386275 RepID=UPI0039BD44B7